MAGDSAAVQAMAFAAREIQGFAGHMVEALTQFADTGEFPDSLFGDVEPATAGPVKRKRKAKGPKKERAKRKPSAFNQFVKEQIAVLRARDNAEGQNNNNTFKEAVANWKKLPDAERKAYTENFKAAEAAKAAALEKGAAAPDDDEEEEEEEQPAAQVEEEEEDEEEEEEEPPKEPTPPPPAPKKEKKRKDKEGADKEAKKKAKKEKAAAAAPAAAAPAAPPAPAADAPKKKKKKNKDKEKNKQ